MVCTSWRERRRHARAESMDSSRMRTVERSNCRRCRPMEGGETMNHSLQVGSSRRLERVEMRELEGRINVRN